MLRRRTASLLWLFGCAVWVPMAMARAPFAVPSGAPQSRSTQPARPPFVVPSGAPQSQSTLSQPRSTLPQPPALASLDECIRRLDPQADIGFDRIAARCPDLAHQLEQSGWARWLPREWRGPGNDLSAASLQELRELAARELTTTLSSRAPDVQSLGVVLETLENKSTEKTTGWSRFKNWLRSVFASRGEADDRGWLTRMISRAGFSQSMLDLISYAALAAVVALAVLIVLNELRAAGVLKKHTSGKRSRAGHRNFGVIERGWASIQRAQPGERPRLLLELIATQLAGPPFVPPSRALTVRELVRTAPVSEPGDRDRLAELAYAAERVRFSGHQVPDNLLEEPLARGRELLDRLTTRAPA